MNKTEQAEWLVTGILFTLGGRNVAECKDIARGIVTAVAAIDPPTAESKPVQIPGDRCIRCGERTETAEDCFCASCREWIAKEGSL